MNTRIKRECRDLIVSLTENDGEGYCDPTGVSRLTYLHGPELEQAKRTRASWITSIDSTIRNLRLSIKALMIMYLSAIRAASVDDDIPSELMMQLERYENSNQACHEIDLNEMMVQHLNHKSRSEIAGIKRMLYF